VDNASRINQQALEMMTDPMVQHKTKKQGPNEISYLYVSYRHMLVGQYIFLNYPRISPLQWHLFTLIPNSSTAAGAAQHFPSSRRRVILLIKDNSHRTYTHSIISGPRYLRAGQRVLVEGPYGRLTIPFGVHPTVILIAGGIGVTPMLALLARCNKVTSGQLSTSLHSIQRVVFILSVRTEELVDLLDPFIARESAGMMSQFVPRLFVSDRNNHKYCPKTTSSSQASPPSPSPPLPHPPLPGEQLHVNT
jgi:hypothetical protein